MIVVLAAAALPLIVGDWAYRPALRDAGATVAPCETDHGMHYGDDHRFATFDGTVHGTWRMDRTGLIEQVTSRRDAGMRERRVWPQPTVTTLRWLSPNHINATDAGGGVTGLVRCKGTK